LVRVVPILNSAFAYQGADCRTSLLIPGKGDFWGQRRTGRMASKPKSAQSQRLNTHAECPQNAGSWRGLGKISAEPGIIGGAMRTRTTDPDVYRRRATGSAVVGDLVTGAARARHRRRDANLVFAKRWLRVPALLRKAAELFLISELDLAAVAACAN
jgi:hypothetical protein